MNKTKKSIFLSLFFFILSLTIDLILKMSQFQNNLTHFNRGFIFGSLQDLPPSLTLITLTSFGGLLVFIYLVLIVLLSDELKTLKVGLGLLIGGVLGNVIDRALHGGTLDFIPLTIFNRTWVYYNPADLFQWIGALLIMYNIFKNDKAIWYPENQRTFYLVNFREQIRFAFKFTILSFSTSLVLGIFSISYLTLTLNTLKQYSRSTVIGFAISYLAISLSFTVLAFIAGIFFSQRSAGPLYAFEKYVESLLNGDLKDLKLREGDNYQHLINVANNLKSYFEKNN
jgi:signal peptidase II